MIRCAAISYTCDQNAPSTPYLVDLPDNPTKEQVEEVLREELREVFGMNEEGARDDGETEPEIVIQASSWGDLESTTDDGSNYVIVSFPPEHKDQLRNLFGLPLVDPSGFYRLPQKDVD